MGIMAARDGVAMATNEAGATATVTSAGADTLDVGTVGAALLGVARRADSAAALVEADFTAVEASMVVADFMEAEAFMVAAAVGAKASRSVG
jgi:hypothetical protein